jgi:hypothetical protein
MPISVMESRCSRVGRNQWGSRNTSAFLVGRIEWKENSVKYYEFT